MHNNYFKKLGTGTATIPYNFSVILHISCTLLVGLAVTYSTFFGPIILIEFPYFYICVIEGTV